MTDTKPRTDNAKDVAEWVLHYYGYQPAGMTQEQQWLYLLAGELKRIHEAKMPESVAWMENHKAGQNLNWERVDHPYAAATPLYGPELLAYAQRKDAEAREQRERADYNGAEWAKSAEAIVVLQKEKAALIAENEGLRKLLAEAAEDVEDWGSYASEYFQNKHDLAGNAKKYRDAVIDNAIEGMGK